MAPYSMDLRKRVAKAWDAGMDADAVAAEYDVSRAWVHRLIQRRRETGSLAPRKQTKFRRRVLTAREEARLAALILARPANQSIDGDRYSIAETRWKNGCFKKFEDS